MLKIHETTTPSGEISAIFLRRADGALAIVRQDGVFALPEGGLEAVMSRFGKPLDPASRVMPVDALALDGDRALRHVRHMAHYDVIALDYLVYDAPGAEPLCALATTVAGALEHLARAAVA